MPLPDDTFPEDTNPQPEDVPVEGGIDAQSSAPTPPVAPLDPVQASDEATDSDFNSLADVAAQEFAAKNPQPSMASQLPSKLDTPVPSADAPQTATQVIPAGTAQTAKQKRNESGKSYRERRQDFRELKQQATEEFKRKQGKGGDSQPGDSDDFGSKVNQFNQAGGAPEGADSSSGGISGFAESVAKHGEQQDSMITEAIRRLDEQTRKLELERL